MNRNIGVIEKRERPLWPQPRTVADAEDFAAAVAGRYSFQGVTLSHAELALAYEAPHQTEYVYASPRVDISPAIAVHQQFTGATRDIAVPPAASGYSEAQAAALFERLFSRRTRISAFEPGSARPAPLPNDLISPIARKLDSTRSPEAVERVLPRAASAEKKSALPANRHTAAAPDREVEWGTPAVVPPPPTAPVTLPAPEIRRVADQVMREIDHRIEARRERMGRR